MLKTSKAYSSFSVNDLEETKKFYQDTLGLEVSEFSEMGILNIKLATGGLVMVYPKGEGHSPASFTVLVLNFPVSDIDKAVDDLKAKGVKFETYDNEWVKTDEKGIAHGRNASEPVGIAWFQDPSGNILSVIQEE
jgi:predicted enzyme related to lactoylglutathione lyase